jgi:hypothetical protein
MNSKENPNTDSPKLHGSRLRWHPAFVQAMQLELADYKDVLEFKHEYQLTAEPLRMDLLIIKKPRELQINKNIARIFRSDNILEYKSPRDYLSVKDFLKVYAYANLYAAITKGVRFSDLTLTFVAPKYPRELIKYLTRERHYTTGEPSPGIHLITGDCLPIQIIESGKLSPADNLWLKSLAGNLKQEAYNTIFTEGKKYDIAMDAYLEVVIRAYRKQFREVDEMSRYPTLDEIFTEAGYIPKWLEQGREQGIEQGVEKGVKKERKEVLELIDQCQTLEQLKAKLMEKLLPEHI